MSCGTCPRCVRAAAYLALRERTYPLVVPVLLVCPRAPWAWAAPFAVRWGHG